MSVKLMGEIPRRPKKILPEVRDSICGIESVADSGVELDALAKLEPKDQKTVAGELIRGRWYER